MIPEGERSRLDSGLRCGSCFIDSIRRREQSSSAFLQHAKTPLEKRGCEACPMRRAQLQRSSHMPFREGKVTRLHEVTTVAKFKLTNNLIPRFEYRFQRYNNRDFQTSVMNPYAYAGPAIDPAGTTGLQRMLFLGADTPGYKAHVFSATLEYHF